MTNRNIGLVVAAVTVTVIFTIMALIIYGQSKKIEDKNNMIEAIRSQSKIDIDAGKKEAELEKQKAAIKIEKMSADDVVNLFITDAENLDKSAFLDEIFIQQINHFNSILEEVGIYFARDKQENME